MFKTDQILDSAEILDGEFITKQKTTHINREEKKGYQDYHIGQIGVVTVDKPGMATLTMAKFRYIGNDQWEKCEGK